LKGPQCPSKRARKTTTLEHERLLKQPFEQYGSKMAKIQLNGSNGIQVPEYGYKGVRREEKGYPFILFQRHLLPVILL